MLTWAQRRECWRLRAELRRLDREHRQYADLPVDEFREHAAAYFAERRPIDYRLWELESIELAHRAEKLAIDVPTQYDEGGTTVGRYFYSLQDRNALKKAIRQERRQTAGFWAGLIVPILSLLVALAAVLSD